MTNFYFKTFLLAASLASGITVTANGAGTVHAKHDLANYRYRVESGSAFNLGKRQLSVEKINELMYGRDFRMLRTDNPNAADDAPVKPFASIPAGVQVSDLEAPGGEIWYSVAEMDYKIIPAHDNILYDDKILQEFTFTIYDYNLNVVGVVKDQMEYREDEVRTVMCELAPFVSRNFFNDDDNLELVVALGINPTEGHENHYRSVVYTIGGEKDEQGYDKILMSFDSLIADVVEGPVGPDGKDNFYVTFTDNATADVAPGDLPNLEPGDDTDWSFWTYLCSQGMNFTIYGPADGQSRPRQLFSKTMQLIKLPGDQQYTPFMISTVHDGKVYFVQSEYKETFYNPYSSPIDESMAMREENELLVNFYIAGNDNVKLSHTTAVKFQKDPADEDVLASYYGIGTMRYREDIDFTHFPGDKPALFVNKQDYVVGSDDSYVNSFYVYDGDGNRIRTLIEKCDRAISLTDIDGFEPQQLFTQLEGSNYRFSFVDLVSGKKVNSFTNNFYVEEFDDFELLLANMDRVAVGNSYMYVVEMRMPIVDENDHDIMRFMWINSKGECDHIDYVDMGMNVVYAKSYISSTTLDPKFFDSDPNYEYMLLIKRAVSTSSNDEHLLIGKAMCEDYPTGKDMLLLTPDETKGSLNTVVPTVSEKGNRLAVCYLNDGKYTVDHYSLPLDADNSGVDDVIDSADGGVLDIVNGVIRAHGGIEVYNISGTLVAKARGSLDSGSLPTGVYIITADGKTQKLFVK